MTIEWWLEAKVWHLGKSVKSSRISLGLVCYSIMPQYNVIIREHLCIIRMSDIKTLLLSKLYYKYIYSGSQLLHSNFHWIKLVLLPSEHAWDQGVGFITWWKFPYHLEGSVSHSAWETNDPCLLKMSCMELGLTMWKYLNSTCIGENKVTEILLKYWSPRAISFNSEIVDETYYEIKLSY